MPSAEPDWDKVPAGLRYLIPAAKEYVPYMSAYTSGEHFFDDEDYEVLGRLTAQILANGDFERWWAWAEIDLNLGEEEVRRIGKVFALLDVLGFVYTKHSEPEA